MEEDELQDLLEDPRRGLTDDAGESTWLAPMSSEAHSAAAEEVPTEDSSADEPPPQEGNPPLVDLAGVWWAEVAPEFGLPFAGGSRLAAAAKEVGDIDPRQILRDRPNVYAAYFRERVTDGVLLSALARSFRRERTTESPPRRPPR